MEAETPLETEAKSKRREQSRGMSNRNKRNGGQKMTQQQTSWGLRILYCDVRQHRSDSCTLDFLTTRRRKLKGTVPDVAVVWSTEKDLPFWRGYVVRDKFMGITGDARRKS